MKVDALSSDIVTRGIRDSAETIGALSSQSGQILAMVEAVAEALADGGKVLTAGNGGSAAEALHLAEELMGRYRSSRRPLPAVALVADTTTLTCIGNDFGFDHVFSRQVTGLGQPGDILVVFSTSGNAANLVNAVAAAREKGVTTACLLGRDGGKLAAAGDHEVIVPGADTARIQEAHQVILHLILEGVETCCAEE